MKTVHQVLIESSESMEEIENDSVSVVVTSPPYPMIEMWDEMFSIADPKIDVALDRGDGQTAFKRMHRILDRVWQEVERVLLPGGIACINIGDATRNIKDNYMLFPNHARIISAFAKLGFSSLPDILWRKQSNAPSKFMGSGMLPACAYVTLEHEYILILRKGGKRMFTTTDEKENRRESAYFWEERNIWYSDVWMDLKGARQKLCNVELRERSAAFPFEIPYRLINMFSTKNDLVLDPFLGTGTTMFAAMASGRNCIGYETDSGFLDHIIEKAESAVLDLSKERVKERLSQHKKFVTQRQKQRGPLKHENIHYGFPVMTAQEKKLYLSVPESVTCFDDNIFEVVYES